MRLRAPFLVLTLVVALAAAPIASATTFYPDYSGSTIDFTGINETSSFGDPEPLFGAPTGVGDSLLFFPSTFLASTAGGGVDQTGSLLNLTMTATGGNTIDTFTITEFGDATLSGAGTAGTGTFASLAGFATVLATTGGPIVPVIIPFVGVFAPSDTLTLPTDPGTTIWTASAFIDVASVVPDATLIELQFDNNLFAFSEASSSATIQKKVVGGPAVVITVPEPATAALLFVGLLGIRARSRS